VEEVVDLTRGLRWYRLLQHWIVDHSGQVLVDIPASSGIIDTS
jgi:hypothetical protein